MTFSTAQTPLPGTPNHRRPKGLTRTLYFREVEVGVTHFGGQPIRYVTYTTPSVEDTDWELDYSLTPKGDVLLPRLVWSYDDDTTARTDYPIYNKLAAERNWSPVEPMRKNNG